MKVFQAINNPYNQSNPFIPTIMEGMHIAHNDVIWGYDMSTFWEDEIFEYDIIHIHWPVSLYRNSETKKIFSLKQIKNRLKEIKKRGIKILCECHNFEPHYCKDDEERRVYGLIYENSDYIIHLGNYSLNVFTKKYPLVKHVLIPHHVYDRHYTFIPTKEEALNKLGLSARNTYILCFGMFRSHEEQRLILDIIAGLKQKNLYIIAPSFQVVPKPRGIRDYFRLSTWLKIYLRVRRHIIITGKGINAVPDDMLPYYYAASDICLIQRKQILNSGNAIMGLYMGKVIIGPNVGNLTELLNATRNPAFNPKDKNDIISKVRDGLRLIKTTKGQDNKAYAIENWNTLLTCEKFYNLYKECLQ